MIPCGRPQNVLEMFQFARVHADFAKAAQRGILPQQTHDDRFAVQHRNHGNADVHLGVVNAHLDAAVLRQAFFRDVEMAQNFDARNDGRLKSFQLRRHGHFLQLAVNAVADAEFVLERFEVDVRRAQFDRVLQNLVDEADDRSLVLRAFVQIVVLGIFVNDLDAFFLVERADGVRADAEAFFDFALDGFAGGEHRLEVQAGHGFQRVESLRGEQPAGGDFDVAVDALERKEFLLQQNARGKKGEKLTIRIHVFERRVAEAVFGREPAENFLLALRPAAGRAAARPRPAKTVAGTRPCVPATASSKNLEPVWRP